MSVMVGLGHGSLPTAVGKGMALHKVLFSFPMLKKCPLFLHYENKGNKYPFKRKWCKKGGCQELEEQRLGS